MNNITENTRRFIENADIDFFTYFIKAWIPFNSWYKNKWHELHSDRAAINTIKDTVNEARSAITNFIENDSDDAKTFKSYLSSLHFQLLENDIRNQDLRVSFQNVKVGKNRTRVIDETYRGIKYRLERRDVQSRVDTLKVNVSKSDGTPIIQEIVQSDYCFHTFSEHRELQNLSHAQRERVKTYYKEIIPYVAINFFSEGANAHISQQGERTSIGAFTFNGNAELIAQGMIEILYSLRCALFHGELNPNEANNEVYKNAYNILFMVLQKLR